MVTIGPDPILWHIIKNFADFGMTEIIIAGGYKWETIKEFVAEKFAAGEGTNITIVDTGLDTCTGGRVKRLEPSLRPDDGWRIPFLLTYGDGLADINYNMLIDHHIRMSRDNGALVTLSAVNPPSRFGRLRVEDGLCSIFTEKGQDPEGWINAGFYVVSPDVLELIPGDACIWEKDILPQLAMQGRLAAYQHPGEFQMMDTWRDRKYLEEVWEGWRLISTPASSR
jgi:glucose-1-phosphate cytidylyltransferase